MSLEEMHPNGLPPMKTDVSDVAELAELRAQLTRAEHLETFWSLTTQALVVALIETAGTNTTMKLIVQVDEQARQDFPRRPWKPSHLTHDLAFQLLEETRRLSTIWQVEGTIAERNWPGTPSP